MSKNLKQVYDANPATTFQTTDLIYIFRSPYGLTNDMASTYGNMLTRLQNDLPYGTAISNINGQISSLQASVTGLSTTLGVLNTAVQTPEDNEIHVALSGDIGNDGSEAYPLNSVFGGISASSPTVTTPFVVLIAPGPYPEAGPLEISPYLSLQGQEGSPPTISINSGGTPLTLSGAWTGANGNCSIINFNVNAINFDASAALTTSFKFTNIVTLATFLIGKGSADSTFNLTNHISSQGATFFAGTFKFLNCQFPSGLDIQGKPTGTIAYINGLTNTGNTIILSGVDGPATITMINSPNLGIPITLNDTLVTLKIDRLSAANGFTFLNGATINQVEFLDDIRLAGQAWIAVDGSDTSGIGSQQNPWALPSFANSVVDPLDNATFTLGAGNYTDSAADILMTVNKVVCGDGISNTLVAVQAGVKNWSLSNAWTGNSGSIEFNNFQTDSSIAWDFASIGANGTTSYLVNFKTNLGIAVIGVDKTTDYHYSNDSFLNGNSFFLNLTAFWNNVQAQGQMYIMSAGGSDTYARITSCNFPAAGNSLVATGSGVTYARIETTILPFLTIDGLNVELDIDVPSYRDCAFAFLDGADYTQVNVLTGSVVKWGVVSSTSQQMIPWNAYTANNAVLVTLTLPSTAKAGTEIEVSGLGAGGWSIAQNASQIIHNGSFATTTGVGGSLSSTNRYDSVTLRCVVDSTTWVVTSRIGTLTVV